VLRCGGVRSENAMRQVGTCTDGNWIILSGAAQGHGKHVNVVQVEWLLIAGTDTPLATTCRLHPTDSNETVKSAGDENV
jgi:hypothetical protein